MAWPSAIAAGGGYVLFGVHWVFNFVFYRFVPSLVIILVVLAIVALVLKKHFSQRVEDQVGVCVCVPARVYACARGSVPKFGATGSPTVHSLRLIA